MGKIIAFFGILLFIFSCVQGADITVGDSNGWTTSFNYQTWAATNTFTTNDTLVFNFGATHALDEVSQSNYDNCNPSNSISSTSSSPARVPLTTTTGTRYFICPISNHCQTGMKLAVTVTSASATPNTPPSGNPTTPETPATTTSAPPPPSAAVRVLGRSGGVGLLLLVIGAVLGLIMG